MLLPLLGREIARGLALAQRWVKPWLWLCAGTTAILVPLVIILAFVPWPTVFVGGKKPLTDPLVETVSWRDLATALRDRGVLRQDRIVVVGAAWHEAAKLDVAMGGRVPVICLAPDPRGYGVNVRAASYLGYDAVIATQALAAEQMKALYQPYFDSLTQLDDVMLTRAGKPTARLLVFVGRNLRPAAPGASSYDLLDPLGAWSGRLKPAH
jgi:hypothetical protein